MTDPNDDLASIADPGAIDPDAMTEPDNDLAGDVSYDEADRTAAEPPEPGQAADSPAVQGSPVAPPD